MKNIVVVLFAVFVPLTVAQAAFAGQKKSAIETPKDAWLVSSIKARQNAINELAYLVNQKSHLEAMLHEPQIQAEPDGFSNILVSVNNEYLAQALLGIDYQIRRQGEAHHHHGGGNGEMSHWYVSVANEDMDEVVVALRRSVADLKVLQARLYDHINLKGLLIKMAKDRFEEAFLLQSLGAEILK